MLIDESEIIAAENRIKPYLTPTPLIYSYYYSAQTGADIFLKLEITHPTHSFKVRGAFNAILTLTLDQRRRGVVTASGGNHGLGVALAAGELGVPATVYLPVNTPAVKVDAIRKLGAEIILSGDSWDDAHALASVAASLTGKAYIHPFNDKYVMAGQATIVRELLRQMPRIDTILTSIGGGGLIAGIISAVRCFSPETKVIGVETLGADCMHRSREARRIITLPAITSIAESLGARRTEPLQFDIVTRYAADLVVVSDDDAIHSLIELLREEKLLVEPATACSLAALSSGKITFHPREKIAVIMCGANISLGKLFGWFDQRARISS